MEHTPSTLWNAYRTLKTGSPSLRMRDAARALSVSECELVAADPSCIRLRPDWKALLDALSGLGTVMALVRNEACVHEITGHYANLAFLGHTALALQPDLDLRLFLGQWRHAFATIMDTPRGPLRSLQFFDRFGEAIQKIHLREEDAADTFDTLVERFRIEPSPVCPDPRIRAGTTDIDIDIKAFRTEWLSLNDVHQFHPFLRRWKVSRRQAFRLAPPGHAWRVGTDAAEHLLRKAASREIPILVFVGNRGAIQIHTGPVRQIKRVEGWLNVLDPGFSLHLRTDLIDDAWVVRKPGDCGAVSSLELFDTDGETIITFFGERTAGQPERPEWVALLDELRETNTCAG